MNVKLKEPKVLFKGAFIQNTNCLGGYYNRHTLPYSQATYWYVLVKMFVC